MTTKPPLPGSAEWLKYVTASKVSGILGVSPYDSPMSTWLQMTGELVRPQTDDMSRGHYLEPALLAWWRDRHGIKRSKAHGWTQQAWHVMDGWGAATTDAECTTADDGDVVVEVKTNRYDDDWNNDEGGTSIDGVPLYYWVQTQWQMIVTGRRVAWVVLLNGRLDFSEYRVAYDEANAPALIATCREFWESVQSGVQPELDNTTATYDALRKRHPEIDKGLEVQLSRDEALSLCDTVAATQHAEAAERLARSTVIDKMGRAQFAMYDGVKVARRQGAQRGGVSFVPLPAAADIIRSNEGATP